MIHSTFEKTDSTILCGVVKLSYINNQRIVTTIVKNTKKCPFLAKKRVFFLNETGIY